MGINDTLNLNFLDQNSTPWGILFINKQLLSNVSIVGFIAAIVPLIQQNVITFFILT